MSVGDSTWTVATGDLFVVPSWTTITATAAATGLDLFRFIDSPVLEALHLSNGQLWARPATPQP